MKVSKCPSGKELKVFSTFNTVNPLEELEERCSPRAVQMLALLLVAKKKYSEVMKILKVKRRMIFYARDELVEHFCGLCGPRRMQWALIYADRLGMEQLLWERFKDHPVIGKHLQEPVAEEVPV